ncbi:FxsB family cyclophane-forming radical SAM/SPASM peptide maturase [Nocardia acidivorans]|uniref:FxsB family cyclophane-forming radical SAM/SPASM peptide maturase n=1 Tax=Nocardia acidivorans TaxID=404580 RepID=UPI000A0243A6|nr:FxsB family cyclophane-forming radical SAM/SPASM peptide maturase [Nocardia acidivorans]
MRGPISVEQIISELPWRDWGLDFAVLRRGGWRPQPFNEFIVKVHGHCNLACDYCYVYEMADQSWRAKPKGMSRSIFRESCEMIKDHAVGYALPAVNLVLHGGEPLLVGTAELEYFARTARELLDPVVRLRLGLQTNGVLIDEDVLRICERWNIKIGVSLDGGAPEHDRHRVDPAGRGSHARVVAGLEQLLNPRHRDRFSGLLCTVDVNNDPIRTYESMLLFEPPLVDFTLPHGNWTTPPPERGLDQTRTPYGDWLIAVFDRWYDAPERETGVRLFGDIVDLLLGGRATSELLGLGPIRLAVVETDGSLEQADDLKSAFDGAARIPERGEGNPLDMAMWEPSVMARQIGSTALSATCLECRVQNVCGGGNYAHRFRAGEGFRNPSVYCADLQKLITHIESRVRTELDTARTAVPVSTDLGTSAGV